MRKITVLSMITLDGVMQSPGGPEEDPSGGFEYGGWVAPFDDEVYGEVMQKELEPADYLLGRKTYEIWAAYWPEHGAYWPGINEGAKYVYSNSLKMSDPMVAGWKNSVVINSVEDIRQLKRSQGADIQVWGSGELVQLLLENDLADELRIKIHPLTLGGGKKLFDKGTIPAAFSVAESIVTPSGVIIVHYKRAGQVKTGIVGG
ncbi:MAG: dihydrofolate reductase family protein [Lewinellaceae bacterium]|nr:dihydrofolate reductase family protein [Lewinella sp.]MCB9278578.1 dihydrofolate reductase family protein [Lewinellaceae bacterium]